MRAFIGSTILGWIQLQRKECPFDLLADKLGPSRENGMDLLFLYIPAELRRRPFVLTAQFLEVVNDVKNMTTFLCPSQEHLLRGETKSPSASLGRVLTLSCYSATVMASVNAIKENATTFCRIMSVCLGGANLLFRSLSTEHICMVDFGRVGKAEDTMIKRS